MEDNKSGMAWGGVAFIVIFFLLIFGLFGFGKGGHGYGYAGGYDYDGYGKCGPSNCQIDKDVIKGTCDVIKDNHDIYERQQAEKMAAMAMEIQTLKTEKYIDCQTDKTMAAIGHVGHQVERLDCECLKRPPVWGEAVVACGHEINEFRGRGRCGDRD